MKKLPKQLINKSVTKIAIITKNLVTLLAVSSFIFALAFSSLDLFSRVLFNKVFLWVNPVSQYLFVTSGLFAFLLTIEKNEMLQISLLKKIQKYKIARLILKIFCLVTAIIFIVIFTMYNTTIFKGNFSVEELFYKLPYLLWAFCMTIFFIVYPVFNQKTQGEDFI